MVTVLTEHRPRFRTRNLSTVGRLPCVFVRNGDREEDIAVLRIDLEGGQIVRATGEAGFVARANSQ
tara:strand:+ start:369 stop:566 length:198 start_codon:yes stop_codon:yes gene_type:complete